jgi:serine/threonine-protein kinase
MSVEGHVAGRDEEPNSSISQGKSAPSGKREPREPIIPGFVGPREFGRLLLLKPIARGGMGEVYLAAMGGIEGAERPCVVKLIRKEHRQDASFLARFLDEARIQAQMQHPGVAQVLEAALDQEGQPYVVVEHIQGRDLAEIRQRAAQLKLTLSWSDAVAIAASIADALAHVHERTDPEGRPLEVVHRDLSPQNIMVSYVGDTKLIDFGTARGENRRCQTINGVVFAKPGYVAPEVAANNPGGVAADLYALGIVLWELCAGRRFLQGDSREHLAAVAKGERTPPALSLWLAVPRELDQVVAKLTATRIADRYETARDAAEQLTKLLHQAPSLANGERSVRARIAHLMLRLYPAEPARSRAEFAELVASARHTGGARPEWTGAPGKVDVKELLFPGTRYRLVREIAHGPMSVVHEAQHVDLGRKVALKVLDRQRCRSQEAASRFRHEARVVAQLVHPNLVQIHDFGVSSDGRPYYAMEFLQGETLADRLARQGRLPWNEAVSLCVQACQALESAHALGVIHRDIKPANLFLTTEGVVKILDFGITQTDVEPDRTSSECLSLVGTPEYMAPEQIGHGPVDARADIYALGSVLYELITGCLPHVGANTVTLLDNKVHDKVKPPSQRAKKLGLPRYLDRVLLTALATDLADRYDNMTCLRQDLVWILGGKERSKKTRERIVSSALALTAACVALGVLVHDRWSDELSVLTRETPIAESVVPRNPTPTPRAAENVQLPPVVTSPPAALAPVASAVAHATPEAAPVAPTVAPAAPALAAPVALAAAASPLGGHAPVAAIPPAAATPSPARAVPAQPAAATAPVATTKTAGAPAAAATLTAGAAAVAAPAAASSIELAPPPAALASPAREASAAATSAAAEPTSAPSRPAPTKASVAAKPASASASSPVARAGARPGTAGNAASSPSPARPARSAALESALAQAESWEEEHRDLEALELYRQLGARHPRDSKVLEGWSRVAAETKWWGESLRVAERWAAVDRSPDAHIHLARTQRRLGQLDKAIGTLKALLERNPKDEQASSLLQLYTGTTLALR